MSDVQPTYDELLAIIKWQAREIAELRAAVTKLQSELDEARRFGKRQAAPERSGRKASHPRVTERRQSMPTGPSTSRCRPVARPAARCSARPWS